ncbi:hypothetical protein Cgig2_029520 [Carnegiea gigantea]|uniref:DYW domain-containing protein n=1 Tax=Carnegiea gigantea TaxID=171969 RepID=A0A9Q1KKQ3_9CARY|nr:hypothetical protein Cgig2_029520 [Carnegiea gigantea]
MMVNDGVQPDKYLGPTILKACSMMERIEAGKMVRGYVVRKGMEEDVFVRNALIDMYANYGDLGYSERVFDTMNERDVVSWTALIVAYTSHGLVDEAIDTFSRMESDGINADLIAWNALVSGFARNGEIDLALRSLEEMQEIGLRPKNGGRINYAENIFVGVKQKSTTIWNEMIAAYPNEGNAGARMELFNSTKEAGPKPDVITYNTILAAYARDGKKNEAYELLNEMFEVGLRPNVVTFNILISGYQKSGLDHEVLKLLQAMQSPHSDSFVSQLMRKLIPPDHVTDSVVVNGALAASTDLGLSRQGKELHGYVVRNNLEYNVYVLSALVDMYSECCDMDSAAEVFWKTENRNTVMWNTTMAGYINKRKPYKAFGLFNMMQNEGLKPSPITFMILMPACGEIGALTLGKELHGCLLKCQFDRSSIHIGSALIDMFAKCGCIWEAKQVFDSQSVKVVIVWNSMILSFSAHRMIENALDLFAQMQMSGGMPDGRTFTALLSACALSGLVEEGWNYFSLMEHIYDIALTLEHYTCMVRILGSIGLLDEAVDFIKKMPFTPDACIWDTQAARALFELELDNASYYILLSNIYASTGLWDSSKSLRSLVKESQSTRIKECSCISIGSRLHSFEGGMVSCSMLDDIMVMWHELADDMRDPVYAGASKPIRVCKNLRMCVDCHTSAKLISKIVEREIFVKDSSFYHYMRNELSNDFSCKKVWFLLFNPNDNKHNLDNNCELMASRTSNEHTYDNDRT